MSYIKAISYYLPERVVTNEELVKEFPEWSVDKVAQKVLDNYIKYLGEGILNFCNIFRPNIVVLSGGVANAGAYLFDRVNEYIKERNYGYKFTPAVKVVPAELGYDSGKIGAAALFFD